MSEHEIEQISAEILSAEQSRGWENVVCLAGLGFANAIELVESIRERARTRIEMGAV